MFGNRLGNLLDTAHTYIFSFTTITTTELPVEHRKRDGKRIMIVIKILKQNSTLDLSNKIKCGVLELLLQSLSIKYDSAQRKRIGGKLKHGGNKKTE